MQDTKSLNIKIISKNNIEYEKQRSLVTRQDKLIEETRIRRTNQQDLFNSTQADFYHIGSEIAKCEKDIEHTQESESSRLKSVNELIHTIENLKHNEGNEKERIKAIDDSITDKNNTLSNIIKKLEKLNEEKNNANNALQNWQLKFNDFISIQMETKNKQEIEKTKISASEKSKTALKFTMQPIAIKIQKNTLKIFSAIEDSPII